MKINILPQTRSYVVDAVYQLFNTGEATTEWVGFPKHGEAELNISTASSGQDRVIRDFIRLEGWINGRKELFEEKRPFLRSNRYSSAGTRLTGFTEDTRWMARKIAFRKNELTTVRIRYEAPYTICWDCAIQGYESGRFYLGPGQYWKGNIAEVEIVLENPDTATKHRRMNLVSPGTSVSGKMTRAKTTITIERRQLVPSANGVLRWSQIPDSNVIRFKD